MRKSLVSGLIAIAAFVPPALAHAQAASTPSAALPPLFIRELEPVDIEHDQGDGVLTRLATRGDQRRANAAAVQLSKAVAAALNASHVSAQFLPGNAPPPAPGWVVTGVFYAINPHHALISLPFVNGSKNPNCEVALEISDPAAGTTAPFATLRETYKLKGQGSNFSLNPYVIGAKVAFNKFESASSIDALSKQIAAKILASADTLRREDPAFRRP
ncbi:MAG: hypothetical protein WA840_16370 [Caulobacteraceae bacterium]